MKVHNILAVAAHYVYVWGDVEVVMRVVVIGDVQLREEAKVLKGVKSVVHRSLADHRKVATNACEDIADGRVAGVLGKRPADRYSLRRPPLAALLQSSKKPFNGVVYGRIVSHRLLAFPNKHSLN